MWNRWVTVTDRQQKGPTLENLCFFKKTNLILDYKKNPILLVIAWLPYGITAQQKYSYTLWEYFHTKKYLDFFNFCSGFHSTYKILVWNNYTTSLTPISTPPPLVLVMLFIRWSQGSFTSQVSIIIPILQMKNEGAVDQPALLMWTLNPKFILLSFSLKYSFVLLHWGYFCHVFLTYVKSTWSIVGAIFSILGTLNK